MRLAAKLAQARPLTIALSATSAAVLFATLIAVALFRLGFGLSGATFVIVPLVTAVIVAIPIVAILSGTIARLQESQRQTERALAEAEAASHAKSDFIAAMSHDLRTPLNAVIGFSEIIRDRLLGPDAQDQYARYAADIYLAGQELLDLVNNILDLAKINSNRTLLKLTAMKVRPVLHETSQAVAETAHAKGVGLNVHVAPDLAVYADRRAFRQMLLHLVGNAVKFTPAGGAISVYTKTVKDNGLITETKVAGRSARLDVPQKTPAMKPRPMAIRMVADTLGRCGAKCSRRWRQRS